MRRTQSRLDEVYLTYLAHQRRIHQPTVLDQLLSLKCCINYLPCFHFDPSSLLDTPSSYHDQVGQILENYDSMIKVWGVEGVEKICGYYSF